MLAQAIRRFADRNPVGAWVYRRTPAPIKHVIGKKLLPLPQEPPPPPPAEAPVDIRTVRTTAEIDAILIELDRAAAISDDELRRLFKTFRMEYPAMKAKDPASRAWRKEQLALHAWLHGKPYATTNEVSAFDVRQAVGKPFPYSTQSCDTVGNHLIAIGWLIKKLNLKANSRVLEFGPGWGNTTIALARMGHGMTVVEIEKNFVELIGERARNKDLRITAINGDFLTCKKIKGKFDAVLFFECFHHCSDHRALIKALDKLVDQDGQIMFAAEPIEESFPVPWGLRLDGESLWAIRRFGWMELGFKESYFRQLLDDHGWAVEKHVATDTPWGTLFIARRKG